MFASEPVSRLSTQITRLPRASSSSQRCEPRKPAPPVTRQVAIAREDTRPRGAARRARAGPPDADRFYHPSMATTEHPPAERGSATGGAAEHRPTDSAAVGDDRERLTVAPIVGPEDPRRFTDSGIEIEALYTEADVPADLELGEPGSFPYTRGVHREMYRKQ